MKTFASLALAVMLLLTLPSLAQVKKLGSLTQANRTAGRGDYKAAIELYEKASREEPKNSMVYHMWGRTLANMGDLTAAIDQYKKAVELSPNKPELLNDLGVTYTASGKLSEGAAELRKAVAASPKYVAAWNNLGVTLMRLGNKKEAADAFRASLKMQPGSATIQQKLKQVESGSGGSETK